MNLKNASVIALTLAGLLAGASALAGGNQTVTCRPGHRPQCPPPVTAGFTDWGMVSNSFTGFIAAQSTHTLEVQCPVGQVVLGGGGSVGVPQGYSLIETSPLSDGSGWGVTFYNEFDFGRLTEINVDAICATVD